MRLTLKSVQEQAQAKGYEVNGVTGRYECDDQRFANLAAVVNYLNQQGASVVPDLTINEAQQLAAQMDLMVQPSDDGYQIFYHGQLLGEAKKLSDVVAALPEYKQAIATYYEEELKELEQKEVAPEATPTAAWNLNKGDEVFVSGQKYEVARITQFRYQRQQGHSIIHRVDYILLLVPTDFKYVPYTGEDREGFYAHVDEQRKAFALANRSFTCTGDTMFPAIQKCDRVLREIEAACRKHKFGLMNTGPNYWAIYYGSHYVGEVCAAKDGGWVGERDGGDGRCLSTKTADQALLHLYNPYKYQRAA